MRDGVGRVRFRSLRARRIRGYRVVTCARGAEPHNPAVVRPVRRPATVPRLVRRRHRTWMLSMAFASLGWAAWWVFAFLKHFAPDHAPTSQTIQWIGVAFAVPGFLVALWTIRARLAWILITLFPLCANASLLSMPIVMKTLRIIREEHAQPAPAAPETGGTRAPGAGDR